MKLCTDQLCWFNEWWMMFNEEHSWDEDRFIKLGFSLPAFSVKMAFPWQIKRKMAGELAYDLGGLGFYPDAGGFLGGRGLKTWVCEQPLQSCSHRNMHWGSCLPKYLDYLNQTAWCVSKCRKSFPLYLAKCNSMTDCRYKEEGSDLPLL